MSADVTTTRVQLLGSCKAFVPGPASLGSGAPVVHTFINDKRYQLLAYLAWADDWVSRDKLADLFWSEDTGAAKQNLRGLLRRVQELGWPTPEVERTRLRWKVAADLARFRNALEARNVDTALTAYTGSLLKGLESYEDNEFANWLEVERELLHGRWRDLVFTRVSSLNLERRYRASERLLKNLLDADPLDEEALLAYLEVLHRSGQVHKARSAYQGFAKRLDREMALKPSSATVQFAEALAEDPFQPVLPTVEAPKVSLPTLATSFIGRDLELAEIASLVGEKRCRLLTLLGPGGVGKTRVALQAAHELAGRYREGATFVALEALTTPSDVPLALAEAFAVALHGQADPLEQVIGALKSRELLLVLDNFEHLGGASELVSRLLRACPGLDILATSRERLYLDEEHLLPLEGLAVPKAAVGLEEALSYDAVVLFVERSRRMQPSFRLTEAELPAVLNACRLLQGVPLGIELATAWTRFMSCREIADEIAKSLDFLGSSSRNAAERHRSIRATFTSSWGRLTPKEQKTLRQLSVFRGGFTREAASFVVGASIALLTALVDKSLLRVLEGRYDFHPLMYEYVGEQLAEHPQEQKHVRAKHGRYFLTVLEAYDQPKGAAMKALLGRCREEHDNLLAALAWSQEADEAAVGLRLAFRMSLFWATSGFVTEGREWLTTVLSHPGAAKPTKERARALGSVGGLSRIQADYPTARVCYQEELTVSEAIGSEYYAAKALLGLGSVATDQGDYKGAQRYAEEALTLARQLADEELVVAALSPLAKGAAAHGDFAKARVLAEESLAVLRRLDLPFNVTVDLNNLGFWAWLSGDNAAAKVFLEESLAMAQALPDLQMVGDAQSNLGGVMLDLGDLAAAVTLSHSALELRWEQRDKYGLAFSLENLASIAAVQADPGRAARLLGAAEVLRETIGSPVTPTWRGRYERFMALAKSQLGEAEFAAAWQAGRRLGLEEAVTHALTT